MSSTLFVDRVGVQGGMQHVYNTVCMSSTLFVDRVGVQGIDNNIDMRSWRSWSRGRMQLCRSPWMECVVVGTMVLRR
jgi:hypothetical protein